MSTALVECIPNFSEARRPEIVQQIMDCIRAVNGVQVLDHHSDLDHNRTVVTFVGPPGPVEAAAFEAIACAGRLIDLNHHTGEHPRIGATDVVPFVPIREISMAECIEMARRLGKRVAETLAIPVYLYEEAAVIPERHNLETIRRGQYEVLKDEIATDPTRKPDFGPCELGPAGATVIGARQPLIAFNVYLNTDNVSTAHKIARAVRNSSGGFRYVKAMGILVNGMAQISMNLTNYRQTPLARVVEFIRRESARYGAAITFSELVGLVPQDALVDAATWHLQLDAFEPGQILESKLFASVQSEPVASEPEPDFLDHLASGSPTPGGGSAAAHTGAAAAALVAMVARLTIGKKKYAAVQDRMFEIIETADRLRASLTEAVQQDSAAFEAVMAAMHLPKDSPEQQQARTGAIENATFEAARVPLSVAGQAVTVMQLGLEAARLGNLNAISDAASSLALANAALNGASLNVRINLHSLGNPPVGQPLLDELRSLEEKGKGLLLELNDVLLERAGLPFSS